MQLFYSGSNGRKADARPHAMYFCSWPVGDVAKRPLAAARSFESGQLKHKVSPHLVGVSLFCMGDRLFQCHGAAFVPRRVERRVIGAGYARSLNATLIAWPLGKRYR